MNLPITVPAGQEYSDEFKLLGGQYAMVAAPASGNNLPSGNANLQAKIGNSAWGDVGPAINNNNRMRNFVIPDGNNDITWRIHNYASGAFVYFSHVTIDEFTWRRLSLRLERK